MSTEFMKAAVNALKQSFKECGKWYDGPNYIGTQHLILGGKQDEIDAIKFMAGLHTKQTSKLTVSQEVIDNLVKEAQNTNNMDTLEEPNLYHVNKNGKTLRVLFGESAGVVFVNDKYVPKYDVANIFLTKASNFLYVVPFGKFGMDGHLWMLVVPYATDEKLVPYFEALAKAIVKNL